MINDTYTDPSNSQYDRPWHLWSLGFAIRGIPIQPRNVAREPQGGRRTGLRGDGRDRLSSDQFKVIRFSKFNRLGQNELFI